MKINSFIIIPYLVGSIFIGYEVNYYIKEFIVVEVEVNDIFNAETEIYYIKDILFTDSIDRKPLGCVWI